FLVVYCYCFFLSFTLSFYYFIFFLFLFITFFSFFFFFFFNDTATTEIYTLSLHDALPIWRVHSPASSCRRPSAPARCCRRSPAPDRKSTRLNSSHSQISYAVFCLKKKKNKHKPTKN